MQPTFVIDFPRTCRPWPRARPSHLASTSASRPSPAGWSSPTPSPSSTTPTSSAPAPQASQRFAAEGHEEAMPLDEASSQWRSSRACRPRAGSASHSTGSVTPLTGKRTIREGRALPAMCDCPTADAAPPLAVALAIAACGRRPWLGWADAPARSTLAGREGSGSRPRFWRRAFSPCIRAPAPRLHVLDPGVVLLIPGRTPRGGRQRRPADKGVRRSPSLPAGPGRRRLRPALARGARRRAAARLPPGDVRPARHRPRPRCSCPGAPAGGRHL